MSRLITKLYFRFSVVRRIVDRMTNQFTSKLIREIYQECPGGGIIAGNFSYGFTQNGFDAPCIIGKYTSIASPVRRISMNHLMKASTHPFYFNPIFKNVKADPRSRTLLTIGNDVWIGSNVTILPNVTAIGDGAVIGAGTVVTQNVKPYSIVVGNPGRLLRYRFDDKTIAKLLCLKWWDLDESEIRKINDLFNDVDSLIMYLESRET